MAKTLKNLALALLNATLILVALCLFLAWKTASTVESVTENFAVTLQRVTPLRDEISATRAELQGIRADIADLKTSGVDLGSQRIQGLENKLTALETKITTAEEKVAALAEAPEQLIDYAIETAADQATRSITEIRGCTAPQS